MLRGTDTLVVFPDTSLIYLDDATPPEVFDPAAVGFVVDDPDQARLGSVVTDHMIHRPSPYHRRSFVYWKHDGPNRTAPTDSFGHRYFTASCKGAEYKYPYAEYLSFETDGYRVNGLQHPLDAQFSIAKSQFLRSIGVRIEWVFAAAQPSALPDPHALPDHKRSLMPVSKIMEGLQFIANSEDDLTDREREVLRGKLTSFTPTITYRMQRGSLRPADISYMPKPIDPSLSERSPHDATIAAVFEDLAPTLIELGLFDQGHKLDIKPRAQADILREYFDDHFTPQLAETLGYFWYRGFQHGFLHWGNVSLAAEIVDSESIKGPFPRSDYPDTIRLIPDHKDMSRIRSLGLCLDLIETMLARRRVKSSAAEIFTENFATLAQSVMDDLVRIGGALSA